MKVGVAITVQSKEGRRLETRAFIKIKRLRFLAWFSVLFVEKNYLLKNKESSERNPEWDEMGVTF